MSLLPKAGLFRVGQLDFKLEAAGDWMFALAIPHQSGSAFAVVSILYALKIELNAYILVGNGKIWGSVSAAAELTGLN